MLFYAFIRTDYYRGSIYTIKMEVTTPNSTSRVCAITI